ncbi:MAG: polyprenyl diphosphate synthase [archaeon]
MKKNQNDKLKAIGIIPDGNRRYAEDKGISYKQAYQEGFEKGQEVFNWCINHSTIDKAVIYALSTENLSRSGSELKTLINLYKKNLEDLAESEDIHDNEVNVKVIGRRELIKPIEEQVNNVEKATENYDKNYLRIALGYGGRAEIIDAISRLNEKNLEINEDNLEKELYSSFDLDLIIRTGKYQRLSNFQLWQSAYAELYFTDKLWPEFDREEFDKALKFYEDTKRKFGR